MDIILIAGLWLPVRAWVDVEIELTSLGHRPVAIALPGVDDGSTTATLEDQLVAVLRAVDAADRPLVVGHSAASTLAWLVADRRPESVAGVVMIGGLPNGPGSTYADFFPISDGVMAFPGWEAFDGPDSADLDDETKRRLEASTIPVASGVAEATVELSDERRYGVPVTLVCPEFSPDDAKAWLAAGDLPELQRAEDVAYVDVDSGHWPMTTRPAELARLLADVAEG